MRHGSQAYLHVDCIEAIYRLLDVEGSIELSLQDFVDLLQQAGEDDGNVLDVHNIELDNYVSVSTIYDFTVGIYQGASSLLTAVCPLEKCLSSALP